MGKRGSGSSARGGGGSYKPEYFKETEKAVQLKLVVEDVDLEMTRERMVWVPKSQLSDDGRPTNWITEQKVNEMYGGNRSRSQYVAIWNDAKENGFEPGMSAIDKARAARFEAGKSNYNALIAKAKAAGVKGVRVGMRTSTIEQKMREAGVDFVPTRKPWER